MSVFRDISPAGFALASRQLPLWALGRGGGSATATGSWDWLSLWVCRASCPHTPTHTWGGQQGSSACCSRGDRGCSRRWAQGPEGTERRRPDASSGARQAGRGVGLEPRCLAICCVLLPGSLLLLVAQEGPKPAETRLPGAGVVSPLGFRWRIEAPSVARVAVAATRPR